MSFAFLPIATFAICRSRQPMNKKSRLSRGFRFASTIFFRRNFCVFSRSQNLRAQVLGTRENAEIPPEKYRAREPKTTAQPRFLVHWLSAAAYRESCNR